MNTGKLKIRPRAERGVDYSAERVVLAVNGDRELWWQRSGKYWRDRMSGYVTAPTELELVDMRPSATCHGLPATRVLQEGGRLSKKLILHHADAIDAWLGEGTAAKVAVSYRTETIVQTCEPSSETLALVGIKRMAS